MPSNGLITTCIDNTHIFSNQSALYKKRLSVVKFNSNTESLFYGIYIAIFLFLAVLHLYYDLEIVVSWAFDFIFFIILKIPAIYNATAIHVNIKVTKSGCVSGSPLRRPIIKEILGAKYMQMPDTVTGVPLRPDVNSSIGTAVTIPVAGKSKYCHP